MKSWNIVKKDDEGNKYDIRILFLDGAFRINDVGIIPKGKRKATFVVAGFTDDYSWRSLNSQDRKEVIKQKILNLVPNQLLEEALLEVWQEIKPQQVMF